MGKNKNKIKYEHIFCDICTECISKELLSPDTLCKHSQETNKEWVVLGDEVYEIRPKPSLQKVQKFRGRDGRHFGGTFKLCYNGASCYRGTKCTFAHSDVELKAWNGLLQSKQSCIECEWERALQLSQTKCLSDTKHSGDKRIMYLEPSKKSFQVIRSLPRNHKHMKKNSQQYAVKHPGDDCSHGVNCCFPHSTMEERIWNSLLYHDGDNRIMTTPDTPSMDVLDTEEVTKPCLQVSSDARQQVSSDDRHNIGSDVRQQASSDARHNIGSDVRQQVSSVAREQISSNARRKVSSDTRQKVSSDDRQKVSSDARQKVSSDTRQKVSSDAEKKSGSDGTQNWTYSERLKVPAKAPLPIPRKHKDYGEDQGCLADEELDLDILDCKLSPECYQMKFRTLLYLEERKRNDILQQRCNGMYILEYNYRKEFWFLIAQHSDSNSMKIELALQYSGTLKLTFRGSDSVFVGDRLREYVYHYDRKAEAAIAFDFTENHTPSLNRADSAVTVEFQFNRNFFATLHQALHNLPMEAIKKVMPLKARYISSGKHRKPAVNDSFLELDEDFQIPALEAMLNCSPSSPFLLTGPFGTGKTRVIARAALEIVLATNDAHVLICVHHHRTANAYVEDYFGPLQFENKHFQKLKIVRLVGKIQRIPEDSPYVDLYRIPEKYGRLKDRAIVICTYTGAALLKKEIGLHASYFSYIFLDEAAQALEPEAIIPLQFASMDTKVILAGDHLQTGPKDEVADRRAKEGGLCVSLLQRLHNMYYQSDHLEKHDCMKSLLTNYRCHEAILRLPSNLFYGCSLLTRSQQSDPHPKAPYPLVFVCSSLDNAQTIASGSNEQEAIEVKKIAEKYLRQWPDCWGPFHYEDVCIMTQTHQQQKVVRKLMLENDPHLTRDQVRVSFAIQGLEFRMVVLSTFESREYKEGKLLHSDSSTGFIGSVVSERTFNTVLTRAKSLFVAVGNPFYLLDAEEALVASGAQKSYCWREYLKTCADRGALIFPESKSGIVDLRGHRKLFDRLFSSTPEVHRGRGEDTILQKSKEDLREKIVKWLKSNRVRLYRGKWISFRHESKQKFDDDRLQNQELRISPEMYTLYCTTSRKAEAIPLKNNQSIYRILGMKNRRGALDGAIVKVANTPSNASTYDSESKDIKKVPPLGRVIKVVQQGPEDTILCRVDEYNCNVMIPLDKKHPKFINSPHIAKVLLSGPNDGKRQASVPCFDRESLVNDDTPTLRDVIPFEDARNMLFLVLFIRWGDKFPLPLGAVIDVYPPGYSLFYAERALKAQFNIPAEDDDSFSKGDMVLEYPTPGTSTGPVPDPGPDPGEVNYPHCYTIDEPGSVTLDDALSLKYVNPAKSKASYEFAVHITSVAAHRNISSLIQHAASQGCSIYQKYKERTKRYSMLNPVVAQSMSLDEGCPRMCISVIGKAVRNRNDGSITVIEDCQLKTTVIVSKAKLAYNDVEDMLILAIEDDNVIDRPRVLRLMKNYNQLPGVIPLKDQLFLLQKIALQLKNTRQGAPPNIFYACQLPKDLERNAHKYPLAHAMVEELMIWANQKVAEFMLNTPLPTILLRCQLPPVRDHNEKLENLEKILHPFRTDGTENRVKVHTAFVEQLRMAGNLTNAKNQLHLQRNYPELYSALDDFRRVQRRAHYHIVTAEDSYIEQRHYTLNCHYTHFTSPLRRCFDILVQTVLLVRLNDRNEIPITMDQLPQMIASLNKRTANANTFEKKSYELHYALQCFKNPMYESAYVMRQDGRHISLGFFNPELKEVERVSSHVPLHALMYTPVDSNDSKGGQAIGESNVLKVSWSYRVCYFKGNATPPQFAKGSLVPVQSKTKPDPGKFAVACSYVHDTWGEGKECFKRCTFSEVLTPTMCNISNSLWSLLRTSFTHTLEKGENLQKLCKELQEVQKAEIELNEERIRQSYSEEALSGSKKKNKRTSFTSTQGAFYAMKFAKVLDACEPLHVWIGASIRQKIITPTIQLVEPCPGLQLCVQHCLYPSHCFTNPAIKKASQDKYSCIVEYFDHWESALLSEAAFGATKKRDLVFLRDIDLTFKVNVFRQPSSFIMEPHFVHKDKELIEFHFSEEFVKRNWCYFEVAAGDFICARFVDNPKKDEPCRAVLHMVVEDVQDDNKDSAEPYNKADVDSKVVKDKLSPKKISAKFLGDSNSIISTALKEQIVKNKGIVTCELQIMQCPVPMRRIYRSLLRLRNNRSHPAPLSREIALGRFRRGLQSNITDRDIKKILGEMKENGSIVGGDAVAHRLWREKGLGDVSLNREQWESLRNAMKNKFYLIQGPPGTGKSVTGAHLAYAFAVYNAQYAKIPSIGDGEQYARPVMYCGPSNKSVDRVLDILHKMIRSGCTGLLNRPLRILRLYGKAVERKTHPGPYADENLFVLQKSMDYKCPPEYSQYALHHLIRIVSPCIVEADDAFKEMHKNNKTPLSKDIMEYNNLVHAAELKVLKGATTEGDVVLGEGLDSQILQPYDIVLCTCNEAASFRVQRSLRPAQCIIDEAGMATEPESMPPIQLSDHVVLIGDHKQLQPVIESRDARDRDLSISLFQRYFENNDQVQKTMLTTQYRMHDAICNVASEEFYDGELEADSSVKEGYKKFLKKNSYLKDFWTHDKPIKFCHIVGEESQIPTSDKAVALQSKYNPKEAKCVVQIAKYFVKSRGMPAESLAIITPYKGQKRALEAQMEDWEKKPKVFTIHECQGDEFDMVILSMVRSLPDDEYDETVCDQGWLLENLGFITDQHQICVALTRAKFGLVIVGNANLLKMDETWNNLLTKHYKKRRCYFNYEGSLELMVTR